MTEVHIKAASAICAWGVDQKDYIENLSRKIKVIKSLSEDKRFGEKYSDIQGALLPEIDFKKWLAPGERRKKDVYSKLSLLSSKLALNPLLEKEEINFHDMELMTTHETLPGQLVKYLDDLFIYGPRMTSPKLFPTMANNSMASTIAQAFGIHGQSFGQANILMASYSMIETAFERVNNDLAKEILVVSTDYLTPGFIDSYSQLDVYKKDANQAKGTNPGEGSASLLLSSDATNSLGKILDIKSARSKQLPYKWAKDGSTHFDCLKDLYEKYRPTQYFSAGNGDADVEGIENFVIENLLAQGDSDFDIFRIKDYLGEHSPIATIQVFLSLLAPKGTKTLISSVGPGGQHGGIVIESFGTLGEQL